MVERSEYVSRPRTDGTVLSSKRQSADRLHRASSPFWRARPAAPARESSTRSDPSKVVGAAYSHTDILKMDTLLVLLILLQISRRLTRYRRRSIGAVSPGARTPPTTSADRVGKGSGTPPPSKTRSHQTSNSRRDYRSFMSSTTGSLGRNEDLEDELTYDDDEDEFGLPSLATMRRKKSKKARNGTSVDNINQPTVRSNMPDLYPATHRRLDGGDITEERSLPSYPATRPFQGKILRPQYKEILRGM